MKNLLSICIPTYNRINLLLRLIKSLQPNLNDKYEIVICDDGSTDGTDQVIEKILKENKLKLKYKKIEHSGRPKALKEAILLSNGKYIIISDDDIYFDKLKFKEAINIIEKKSKILNQNNIGGLNFLCKNNKDKIIGTKFPTISSKYSLIDLRYLHDVKGDKCEIYKSELIKKNLYELIENETRIPTIYLQAKMHQYLFLCFNEPIKIVSYYKDGMTKNIMRYKLNSPNYTYITYLELYKIKNNKKNFIKYFFLSINYCRFYLHSDKTYRVKIKKKNYLYYLSFIIGLILFIKDKIYLKSFNENRKNKNN